MAECDWCGEPIVGEATFRCNYCEETFCGDHRLPEKHGCIAVKASDTLGPDVINFLGQFRDAGEDTDESEADQVPEQVEPAGDDCPRCGAPAPKGFTYCTECRDHLSKAEAGRDRTGNGERSEESCSGRGGSDAGPSAYGPQVECERCTKPIPEGDQYCDSCRKVVYEETWREGGTTGGGNQGMKPDGDERDTLELVLGLLLMPFFGVVWAGRIVVAVLERLLDIRVAMVLFVGVPVVLVGAIGAGVLGADDISGTPAEPVVSGVEGFFDDAGVGTEFNATKTERLIHQEVNEERRERGLPPLEYHDGLARDARAHSQDMAEHDYFAHDNLQGETPQQRVSAPCRVGENIALTRWNVRVETQDGVERYTTEQELAEATVEGWMNSPGHRENILRGEYVAEGIGVALSGEDVYVTQDFCAS